MTSKATGRPFTEEIRAAGHLTWMRTWMRTSGWLAVLVCAACGSTKPAAPVSSTPAATSAAPGPGSSGAPAPTPATASSAPEAEGPASLAGMRDEGTFLLYTQETQVATIEHTLEADGRYRGRATVSYAGQSFTQTFAVTVDPAGRWTRLDSESPRGNTSIVRTGLALTVTSPKGTETAQLSPGAVLFENFSPALLTPLLRHQGASGAAQKFPVFVPGRPAVDGTLTRKDDAIRALAGKDIRFGHWVFEVAGLELDILADEAGRVVLITVPVQRAAYVRDGYQGLMVAAVDDPKLSRPEHEVVVDDDVKVKMHDGVELSVDVYRPAGAGKHPTIVVRTPYKKELNELQGRYFAKRGYAYVVQDVRGRFASGGAWAPFVNEKRDGYETIEWAASQPWSTGKVGTIGGSYLGWVQYLAAVEKPPHLVTLIPNVAPPDPLYNIPYEYGAFFMLGSLWWADVVATGAAADLSGAALQKIGDKKYSRLLAGLPVIDLDEVALGGKNQHWRAWIAHPTADAYWAGASYLESLSRVDLPVFIQSGWFDGDGIGSKLAYARLAARARKPLKLVLGPWGHTDTANRRHGNRDFGPEAVAIDLSREYLRWFDHWLKGVDNGIDKEPLVSVFAMGSNRWLRGNHYPLEGTVLEKWHLASGGQANGLGGDGKLRREPPSGADRDTYTYDPGDPTPEPSYYEEPERKPGEVVSREEADRAREAHHDQVLASRRDILVYASEPMAEDTTFAGPISAVLYASTTAKDTDWFVTLVEVDAAGKTFELVQGRLRARYRASMARPTLLTPGKIEKYTLDLWQTGITVKKGDRLRVEIASAAFPVWSRNLNTGGHNETETAHVPATQAILHSPAYPSHVLLPKVPTPR
jgi:putative CocE/NonD family hydrolase